MKTMIYRAFSLMLLCLALVSCKDDLIFKTAGSFPTGGVLLSYRR